MCAEAGSGGANLRASDEDREAAALEIREHWAVSGASGFFWPVFTLFALAPLLRSGWSLYGPAPEFDRVEQHLKKLESGQERDRRRREQRDRRRHDRRL